MPYYPDPREVKRYARLVRAPRGAVRLHVCADAASAATVVEDAEVLFAWKFPPPLYARARRLRWVQAMGAGVDWALPDVPAGTRATYTLDPGPRAVHTDLVGDQANNWAVLARDDTPTIVAGRFSWLTASFPLKGVLKVFVWPAGLTGDV